MRYHLAFDGGGTKLSGLLFDDDLRLLAYARTGGVNANIYPKDQVHDSIRENLALLLDQCPEPVEKVDTIYGTQGYDYFPIASERLGCAHFTSCAEGMLGVLSCGVADGLCALSGTGSDVFWVENGEIQESLGGWGYLIGDDGSGTDIGREALRSLFRRFDGLIPQALLHTRLQQELHIQSRGDLIACCYRSVSPPRLVSSCCRIVAAAAQEGCPVAHAILCNAGRMLGETMEALYHKVPQAASLPICTTGSVLHHCEPVRRAFEDYLLEHLPTPPQFLSPLFEPVVGMVVYHVLERRGALSPGELDLLIQNSRSLSL